MNCWPYNRAISPKGVYATAKLNLKIPLHANIYRAVDQGRLGWSSGSTARLIKREKVRGATRIVRWPVTEFSLVSQPCEPRALAVALKSFGSVRSLHEILAEIELVKFEELRFRRLKLLRSA